MKSLHDFVATNSFSRTRKKICIATYEIEKIHKNGGIATAYMHLAETLVRHGHEVSILVTSALTKSEEEKQHFREVFKEMGIELLFPKILPIDIKSLLDVYCSFQSFLTFETLREYNFDIIHIPDSSGDGYFCLQAKRSGLFFTNTTFIIGAHGSSEWVREANLRKDFGLYEFILDNLERKSIELADIVVSPSQYYIGWMQEHNFKIPEKTFFHLNCPHMEYAGHNLNRIETDQIKEIVFFGRQEKRKGFDVFCESLLQMKKLPGRLKVTILGKPTQTCSFDTYSRQLRHRGISVQRIENFNSAQAIDYISRPGCLVVIPSRTETMCYTVMECLLASVPFLAAKTGAIPELVQPRYHATNLFELNARALAESLDRAVTEGLPVPEPSFKTDSIMEDWAALHDQIPSAAHMQEGTYPIPVLSMTGSHAELEIPGEEKKIAAETLFDSELMCHIKEAGYDKLLIACNTRIARRVREKFEARKQPGKSVVFCCPFISNGAYKDTGKEREAIEALCADLPELLADTAAPMPLAMEVDTDLFLQFASLHGAQILSSYWFMKIFTIWCNTLPDLHIYTSPLPLGWSTSQPPAESAVSELKLWEQLFRKKVGIHPAFISFRQFYEQQQKTRRNLTREERLRAKFIRSPKQFCADSKSIWLRLLSKFLKK